MSDWDREEYTEGSLKEKDQIDIREPNMYKVLLHNDHFTTQEFVVAILKNVFHKPLPEAQKIMLDVHNKGIGVVGLYPLDIAVTSVERVHSLAKQQQYPLKCTYEKE